MTIDASDFKQLEDTVWDCARLARSLQCKIHRTYKSDGSVLTETDLKISRIVEDCITRLFPSCSFVCEETPVIRKKDSPYTFVLDPVDGTDVYSQGLPSFAVALGILDRNLKPCGALIAAPRFGLAREELLVSLQPGGRLMIDGKPFEAGPDKDVIHQITLGSNDHARLDFTHFDAKIRTFGSSIIHLLAPVVYSSIQACINQPSYVWDIAASHAVLLSQGMDISYYDGSKFTYTDSFVYGKEKYRMEICAGTEKGRSSLRSMLPLRA